MAHSAAHPGDAFNARVIEEFRANGGRVGGPLADTPLLLLHHIGARSGIERVTPLVFSPRPDGRCLIVASNAGSAAHPAWYHNLRARPTVLVELGAETCTMQAEELRGADRDALWPELVAASASLRDHQAKTARRIPVFLLTPCRDMRLHVENGAGAPTSPAKRPKGATT